MSDLNAIEMSSLLRPRRSHVYERTFPGPDTPEPEGTRCPQDHARRPTRRTHPGRGRTPARQKHTKSDPSNDDSKSAASPPSSTDTGASRSAGRPGGDRTASRGEFSDPFSGQ